MKCKYCDLENADQDLSGVFICDECLESKKEIIKSDFPGVNIYGDLKTINDLKDMKKLPDRIFGNQYNMLISTLENNIISKSNGVERNKSILSDFDDEARLSIELDLANRLEKNNID